MWSVISNTYHLGLAWFHPFFAASRLVDSLAFPLSSSPRCKNFTLFDCCSSFLPPLTL